MMQQPTATLILASRSPRRRQLLEQAGYAFEVLRPDESAEDDALPGEPPERLVARLARQKAANVAERLAGGAAIVIGCDTVAECDGEILGKPRDEAHARGILERLSGREHRVVSGLCLWPVPGGEPSVDVAVTRLRMDRLSAEQLSSYLRGGGWRGKAGAFGYQDGLDWVHVLQGSESNVVGLPMELFERMLRAIEPSR
jgi:septum formation protein